ncbi:hypothetical protein NC651_034195 [Populus alba x Populus x berolinensis]|nr:hypothetical protein NC651_034195 [Populus alba x Populus x berolinensis]
MQNSTNGSSREVVSTVEEKMTMLKNLPEEVLNLWNNWEIRGMVLLSLLLQTILIVFGPWRKTTGRIWIRILVWSAYLSADMVATVALGNLARSQGDSSGGSLEKANNSIQAFWAPFLLLHLGGPDTITAYSIEDNELWLRHALGLIVQVGVALYVFSRSWPSGILTFIAIPMFIAGVVKYAERTWVLWSSCSKSLKNSNLFDFWSRSRRLRGTEIGGNQDELQREYLNQACTFFHISKYMMQDLATSTMDLMLSQLLISRISVDGAFKVVEVELGLIYDMLYTKAPLIYSRVGIVLRFVCFLLSVSAFITFQVKIDKHDYSTTDIAITYLLFVAAFFLELYAFLCLILSDWTMIWLIDKRGNALTNAIYSLLRNLRTSDRWSRSMSQYNLIRSSIENKPLKCLELLGMDEMMRQMHVNRKYLNGGLKHASNVSLEYETSRCLSEYMMYLLVIRPNMLSKGFEDEGYLVTSKSLRSLKGRGTDDVVDLIMGYNKSHGYNDEQIQSVWIAQKSVLNGVERLANQLLQLEPEKRWAMINEVWIEMLVYAAVHCPWKEHTQQLRRGGELLTHVCFFMLHLGLSEQYEFKEFDDKSIRMRLEFTQEEKMQYSQAKDKYLRRMADMSDIQAKDKYLRRMANISSLTASTPQQGIDSLPSSLLAQTDDQGTGQPPSNNEISLSME